MNIATFFERWGIGENPFRAEEARQDAVFLRLADAAIAHPDFEKIAGDAQAPATAIVFGEKGSGKTAIRLQIARRIAEHNAADPGRKILLVAYDDLNPALDRFAAHVGPAVARRLSKRKASEGPVDDALARLKLFRLVDHMDAILNVATTRLVDAILGGSSISEEFGESPARVFKRGSRADKGLRRDLMLLQAAYDRPELGASRTLALRSKVGAAVDLQGALWTALAVGGLAMPLGVAAAWVYYREERPEYPWLWAMAIALALWGLLLTKRLAWDRLKLIRLGRRVARQLRTLNRSAASFAHSFELLPVADRTSERLPTEESDEQRYAMFARLRGVVEPFGYRSIVVVMDRVDEPTLISGDADRMQAVVWPMLNNKFLQIEGVAFKLLLPIELRHSLFRESAAFFQSARLDKQNLIERLSWTGATLYDICNARVQACRKPGAEPVSLVDIFDADVTRQDLIDALDQMRQPRDAFKFLYQCVQEHCSRVTQEQAAYRIPKIVLDMVRKQQSERVQQLGRGLRPA